MSLATQSTNHFNSIQAVVAVIPRRRSYTRAPHAFQACTSLGLCLSLVLPTGALAGSAFRTTTVVPSVYRQAFSRSQAKWGSDSLLQQGIRLNGEDRLISKGNGMATILCESGSFLFKKKNYTQVSSFCQAQRAAPVQAIPGSQDRNIPFLLAPRVTLVRSPQIAIRWNPVAGVQHYQLWLIRLRDRQLLWGTQVVDTAHTTLPDTLTLEPGESYRLVVEANNGTSSQLEPASAKWRFGLLPQAEAKLLQRDLEEIRSLRSTGVPNQSLALLEATALEQRGLVAESMAVLARQEQQGQSLEGQLQLGRLANLQGLNQQAAAHYEQAAELAQTAGDDAAGAVALAGKTLSDHLASCAMLNSRYPKASTCTLPSPP